MVADYLPAPWPEIALNCPSHLIPVMRLHLPAHEHDIMNPAAAVDVSSQPHGPVRSSPAHPWAIISAGLAPILLTGAYLMAGILQPGRAPDVIDPDLPFIIAVALRRIRRPPSRRQCARR